LVFEFRPVEQLVLESILALDVLFVGLQSHLFLKESILRCLVRSSTDLLTSSTCQLAHLAQGVPLLGHLGTFAQGASCAAGAQPTTSWGCFPPASECTTETQTSSTRSAGDSCWQRGHARADGCTRKGSSSGCSSLSSGSSTPSCSSSTTRQ